MDDATTQQTDGQRPTIVVVSSDTAYVTMLGKIFADEGYQTSAYSEAQAAYDMVCQQRPALVLLDAWLEHRHGGEMLLAMLHVNPAIHNIPVILCTTDARFFREHAAALQNKHCVLLRMPFDLNELLTTINNLLSSH